MKRTSWKHLLSLTLLLFLLLSVVNRAQAQEGGTEAGFFYSYEMEPGNRLEVPVEIRNVQDLYAIDIEIRFDPAILAVEDANPGTSGIQPALGTFLDAGLTLFNEVDNQAGTLRFTMTQVNPSEPKSGEGVILVLYFNALAEGESELAVTMVELSDRLGEAIPVQGVGSIIRVVSGAVVPESTSIPVQDPTEMIVVPTTEATAIPTVTPTFIPTTAVPTETPTNEAEPDEEVVETTVGADQPEEEAQPETISESSGNDESGDDASGDEVSIANNPESPDEDQRAGFSLVRHWWIVLIVFGLVVGLGIYLLITKQ